ncbi:MAG: LPS export ABC transporter permease LptG [Confluentimicrobium sp.]|jgi:lipopolysaccharide export system permease protein|uniref:LPS export ABC transporter permease LptG n=1 Tax=Actibacterium sp. TaxID=1872125 RepID=UPI00050E8186|nr:LPS export ABC transporter permease LptG [Actibacterium sp.]KGB82932.1 permease [Rhodovulum sp. NI22]MBC57924.1 LPS export ABC transporter permease LptG [Actibacterium sp.]MDY6859191.1 LPS export ABC transporter permease LptG [Pseudomonadota bacterium]
MILHFYFARKFITTLIAVFAVFLTILLLLDLVDQIRRFDIGAITFPQALGLAALNAPSNMYGMLPLTVLMATLMLFLGLARTSELVVTRAMGRSALRSLFAPVLAAAGAGVLTITVLNPLVAATSKHYETLSSRYKRGTESVLSISREGLWLRQGDEEGQMVIRAARANLDGTVLHDVTFLALGPQSGPAFRIEAEKAELTRGAWTLTNAKRWALSDPDANPERDATRHALLSLPSDLTPERIRNSFGTPSAIPIWELPAFIDSLERAGFSARNHRVWFQMELALPLVYVAMVMIAAGFTMRHTRLGRTGVMVMLALGLGLGLYFLRNFAQVLGENGQIPAELAAWSPPVVGILLSLGLLLHLEDG